MDVLAVALLVLSGIAISSAFERVLRRIRYDLMAIATVVVVFGGVILALTAFRKMGPPGVILTVIVPMLLHPIFIIFNFRSRADVLDRQNVWGCFYWAFFLIAFTVSGFKSWIISTHVRNVYLLGSDFLPFYIIFGVSVVAGGISMLMMIHQIRTHGVTH